MWEDINPKYGPAKNSIGKKIQRLIQKIWRKWIRYAEHDQYRLLNQIPRYNHSNIKIGDFTYGHPDSHSPTIIYFGESTSLEIGKFCSIAENVTIFMGGYHNVTNISTYPFNAAYPSLTNKSVLVDKPNTKIGNDVWIGAGATIMAGVIIGDGAVIAAGSVVVDNISPYGIVGGNPAKHIRKRFDDKVINELLHLQWWTWDYKKIRANMDLLNSSDFSALVSTNK